MDRPYFDVQFYLFIRSSASQEMYVGCFAICNEQRPVLSLIYLFLFVIFAFPVFIFTSLFHILTCLTKLTFSVCPLHQFLFLTLAFIFLHSPHTPVLFWLYFSQLPNQLLSFSSSLSLFHFSTLVYFSLASCARLNWQFSVSFQAHAKSSLSYRIVS